jgi:hypothetical protein
MGAISNSMVMTLLVCLSSKGLMAWLLHRISINVNNTAVVFNDTAIVVGFQNWFTASMVYFTLRAPLLTQRAMLTQSDLLRELWVDRPAILGAIDVVASAACC